LFGCSNAGDDDDAIAAGMGGSTPVMMGAPIVGTPMSGAGGTVAAGGVGGVVVGGGAGGAIAPSAGAGGMGVAGMGIAGMDMGGAGMDMGGAGGVTAGAGGMGGMAGGTAGTTAPAVKSPCITAGSQVVLIGDSYSNYFLAHTSMATLMTQRAVMNMALMQGQSYRDYAVAGTTLQNTLSGIPSQWNSAKGSPPIHLVIMDGGGNDVLIDNPQCLAAGSDMNAGCKAVVDASLKVGKDLWMSMKAAGVKDVIWFWYPHIPGGLNGNGHDINDYSFELFDAAAKEATTADFRVYMLDTVPIFEGHPDFFFGDGIHANTPGTAAIADAIWKLMKDKCIGQAPASGCCMM
jgi:hypothetical protein